MKKCRNTWVFWKTERYPENLPIPEKCLSYTIFKKSGVDVIIDRSETLADGEYYPVDQHSGYYHTGFIRINKVEAGSSDVHIRFTIDVS